MGDDEEGYADDSQSAFGLVAGAWGVSSAEVE